MMKFARDSVEATGVHKVVPAIRRVAHEQSAPKWLFFVVAWNSLLLHMLLLTDSGTRADLVLQLPGIVVWIGENAALLVSAAGILGTAWATFDRRSRSDRSTGQ